MMLYVLVLIQMGTGYCILDPPPPLLFEDTGCVVVLLSSFWERMHLWGNRGFGLCVMTSSVSVWVVHDDG